MPSALRSGSRTPFSRRCAATARALPNSANRSNAIRITSRTCSSGSRSTPPPGSRTYPAGTQVNSSPRFALFRFPWSRRLRITCNSASLMIPLSPSSSRSLWSVGSYTPSGSASRVWNTPHSSSSWCQSRHDRASRLISSPRISPTWSSPTSASSRWNPGRVAASRPDRPRSSSITTTRSGGQPRATARRGRSYCRAVDSAFSRTCRGVDWRT